jgi:MFS transporter, FSR family, fosmidomycin resistance protein
LAPILMTSTAAAFGWRNAGLVAFLAAGTSFCALIWNRRKLSDELESEPLKPASHSAKTGSAGLANLIRMPLTWFAFSFFFFATLGFGALQNFATSLLGNLYGLSVAGGTSALSGYLAGGAAGLAVGGFLAGGAKGQEKLVGLAFFCSASLAALLALAIVPGWAVIAIMVVMGFGIGLAGPSRDMLVRKSTAAKLGSGAFGRVYGLVYSGADVGLATAPLIFGLLMDAGRTRLVFVGIALSLLTAIFAAQAIAREAAAT